MDQTKIGPFLRKLRKERNLTQEQLAEQLNVSGRTVSRWETGSNMPDLDILIELSEIYDADLREILNGERKSEKMNDDMKEVVLKASEYVGAETEKHNRRVHLTLVAGGILWLGSSLIRHTELVQNHGLHMLSEFCEGAGIGLLLCGLLFTSRYGRKLQAFKQRLMNRSER